MIATSDLVVPKEFLDSAKMSEDEMRVDLAVHLYATRRLTMGRAKRLAGLDQIAFQHEMKKRDVFLNITPEDVRQDVETLRRLFNK